MATLATILSISIPPSICCLSVYLVYKSFRNWETRQTDCDLAGFVKRALGEMGRNGTE